MVTSTGNILTPSLLNQLTAIKRTQRAVDVTTLRLASGLQVNSALDNPQNFFQAQSLVNRASDLTRLLDDINQSIRTVEEAIHGTNAIERLLDQAEAVTLTNLEELRSGVATEDLTAVTTEIVDASPSPLSNQIENDNPVAYYRLDETAGGIAFESTGNPLTFNGTYQGGVNIGAPALYNNGGTFSADFDGNNDRVRILDSDLINLDPTLARTVELVFSADDLSAGAGRQVIYEEGAGVNGLTIYVDNGILYISGEDDQGANRFNDININAAINENQTYHVALVFDGVNGTFSGYLDGQLMNGAPVAVATEPFPSHSGDIGIGYMAGGAQFHDGESNGNGFYFDGQISDVAIYNRALLQTELESHATSLNATTTTRYINTEYDEISRQIDFIVEDANYRGINLLENDDLITDFNEDRSNFLISEGTDFTQVGLGLERFDFNDEDDIDEILADIREARERVRTYGRTLASDLSIIQTREDFTRETINNLQAGADDLTIADQNEEGANLLALQTRQQLQFANLALRPLSIADFLL